MRNVEIKVFKIAETAVDRSAVQSWLDHIGADEFEIPEAEAVTDPALLIAMAAKRCYMSFQPSLNPNLTKVRKDMAEYLDNILKSGHGSVFEHAVFTFAIEGVSRVFTGEMNRHRAGVGISEGSMRYIRYEDIPWWLPTSIRLTPDEEKLRVTLADWMHEADDRLGDGVATDEDAIQTLPEEQRAAARMTGKKLRTQKLFAKHMNVTEGHYAQLQDIWKEELAPDSKFHAKKQITSMMRRIMPMGIATGGVWTMNARAVRHIIALRATDAAEEEIAYVFNQIAKLMVESQPHLLGDFTQDEQGFWSPKYRKV
jgi:thymidylate synthase (FAD)